MIAGQIQAGLVPPVCPAFFHPGSWIGSDRLRRALAGDLAPRAHTTLLNKDTHLALDMARRLGTDTPVGSQAAALFARACEGGFAAFDDASLLELLRRDRL